MIENINSLWALKAFHRRRRTKIMKVQNLVPDLTKLTVCCHLLYSNIYTLSHVQIPCWLHVVTEMPNKAFCVSFLRKRKMIGALHIPTDELCRHTITQAPTAQYNCFISNQHKTSFIYKVKNEPSRSSYICCFWKNRSSCSSHVSSLPFHTDHAC